MQRRSGKYSDGFRRGRHRGLIIVRCCLGEPALLPEQRGSSLENGECAHRVSAFHHGREAGDKDVIADA